MEKQDYIGEASIVLSSIVHKKTATSLELTRNNNKASGEIIIKCEELGDVFGTVKGCFRSADFSKNTFYKIFSVDEKNGTTVIYKSEVLKNGCWKPFEIDIQIFCNGDMVSSSRCDCDSIEPSNSHQSVFV